jgi:glutaredoxin
MSSAGTAFRLNLSGRQWLACGVVLCAAVSTLAQAQGVFRIVGPDGKVTYSDHPPTAADSNANSGSTARSSASSSGARLPVELQKAASEFPVVLYTAKDCGPCNSGRNLLVNRGIPFTEKTVDNNESVAALKQLTGQNSIPLLSIGAQQLKGYSDSTWSQYLTSAGYPEKSALPRNYSRPAASPLAEATQAAPARAATPSAAVEAPAAEPEVPVAPRTTGIRF